MNIDVHSHVIPRRVIDFVTRRPAYGVTTDDGRWNGPGHGGFSLGPEWYVPEAKLAEMRGRELDAAVLSIAPKPVYFYELGLADQLSLAREVNAGLADFAAAAADRLRWMAHVPLTFPEQAAEVLADAVSSGTSGVQIGTSASGYRLDEAMFDPFWAAVDELAVPVFLHPAYELAVREFAVHHLGAVAGLPLETTVALERLICSGHFDRYPRLQVIAAHGGGFFPFNVGRLQKYSQVRGGYEAAAEPWDYVGRIKFDSKVDDIATLRFLLEKAGADNVMIGTDCPFGSAPGAPVRDLRMATGADEEAFRLAAETNAARLFGFPVAQALGPDTRVGAGEVPD